MISLVASQLSPAVLALVAKIETYAGIDITVREDKSRRVPACSVGGDYAFIDVPDINAIRVDEFLHELLHVERNWPEQVPQLIARDEKSPLWGMAGRIDNRIEHIVIVPRMANYGFEPYKYWNDQHRVIWSDGGWKSAAERESKVRYLLANWLTLHFNVTDPQVRTTATDVLREEKLLETGTLFCAEIDREIQNKAKACAVAAKFLLLPVEQLCLAYCDPRKRECEEKALPTI